MRSAMTLAEPIDRRQLVRRHNVELTSSEPVQVGNGEFAFTADITGLQSFEPCNTMSHWGWHSQPLPPGTTPEDFRWSERTTATGRVVPYPIGDGSPISAWLSCNPHRCNLGRLALRMTLADGSPAQAKDLRERRQTLDLWSGLLTSRFSVEGRPVVVETCCHPRLDAVAVRISSPLIASGRLRVELAFPYPDLGKGHGAWDKPEAHRTTVTQTSPGRADIGRQLDADRYQVALAWSTPGTLATPVPHHLVLSPGPGDTLELLCAFAPGELPTTLPSVDETIAAAAAHWPAFWHSGAAIDLSGSHDPRWRELERRIVLSQYLMAVNEAGSLPPQESGLVDNGWFGRFHFEMLWWHAAHYALWDRWPLARPALGVYRAMLPQARERARRQGYPGARWMKCTGPDGVEWPHIIHATLIWQQPHPIFFAELDYRAHPTAETLAAWRDIVQESATCMAALAHREPATGRFVLGPPLHVVSENIDPDRALNPAFELSYWRFGLRLAQDWRERLGLGREPLWDEILAHLAPLPVEGGTYVLHEGVADMWTTWAWEHPALTGALGWLPGDGVDRTVMDRTFQAAMRHWDFAKVWGWDFPMLAMCAARLGRPSEAVDLLLHERFSFTRCGLSDSGPFPYFPSNGGLLYAVALMAAGWDGAPDGRPAPGFPADGSWSVRCEGLHRAP